MASKTERTTVNAAGLVQGIVLVTFPAASTIFTSKSEYGLSSTQYGAMFLPQVALAITASLAGAGLARRITAKRVYLLGLACSTVSMVILLASTLVRATQTIMWVVIFFFASAGASAAYLTVSETWPIEIRAEAIAVFFAIGCIAGALGPAFYGALIGTGSSRTGLFVGYLIGAGIMLIGGLVEVFLGVQVAGKSLEQVTKPLTSADQATPAAPAAA
jgi:hypothetical protein